METYNKKLYRSKEDRIIFGVMGGFGKYFDVDPTILRVIYVVFAIFTACLPGILAYVLMALIIPEEPKVADQKTEN